MLRKGRGDPSFCEKESGLLCFSPAWCFPTTKFLYFTESMMCFLCHGEEPILLVYNVVVVLCTLDLVLICMQDQGVDEKRNGIVNLVKRGTS